MALMLQRFDISLADCDYKLVVSETLTLKPANLHIHARRRDGLVARPRSTAQDAPTRPSPRRQHRARATMGPFLSFTVATPAPAKPSPSGSAPMPPRKAMPRPSHHWTITPPGSPMACP